MESAADLIGEAAGGHAVERFFDDRLQLLAAGPFLALEQQIDYRRVREFRRVAESAVRGVEALYGCIDHRIDDARIEFAARAVKNLRLRDSFFERVRGVVHFGAALLEGVGDREQGCA